MFGKIGDFDVYLVIEEEFIVVLLWFGVIGFLVLFVEIKMDVFVEILLKLFLDIWFEDGFIVINGVVVNNGDIGVLNIDLFGCFVIWL